jgi:hypothetical protein
MGNDPINSIDPDGGKDIYYNSDGSHHHTENWLIFWKTNRYWDGALVSQGKFWAMTDYLAVNLGVKGVNAGGFEYVGPKNLNWADEWAAREGLLSSMSYDWANSVYVIGQSLLKDPHLNHLNGDGITHGSWEHQEVGIDGLSNTIPGLSQGKFTLKTSSKSMKDAVTYTITKGGEVQKFGVASVLYVNGKAYYPRILVSKAMSGKGAKAKNSNIMPKMTAHKMEKLLRTIHWNSVGGKLKNMRVPYPVNLDTGAPIKPK